MGKTCAICGKPSGMYPLCTACFKLRDAGEIIKCENCGTWYRTKEGCPNCKPKSVKKQTKIEEAETTASDELTCIICGKPSNGKHFCPSCFYKYKDRAVDIRIIHCMETKVLDEYGNKTYKCDDGRLVRSRAEAIICSWLYNQKIRVKYEETVYYKDEKTGEIKELHPDFYLPDYDLYIEYNEITTSNYKKSKEFTQNIYKQQGKKVVSMTDEELQDVAAFIKPLLIP